MQVSAWFTNFSCVQRYLFHKQKRRIQNTVKDLRWSLVVKMRKNFKILTIFAKNSILNVSLNSKYASIQIILGEQKADKLFDQADKLFDV